MKTEVLASMRKRMRKEVKEGGEECVNNGISQRQARDHMYPSSSSPSSFPSSSSSSSSSSSFFFSCLSPNFSSCFPFE